MFSNDSYLLNESKVADPQIAEIQVSQKLSIINKTIINAMMLWNPLRLREGSYNVEVNSNKRYMLK